MLRNARQISVTMLDLVIIAMTLLSLEIMIIAWYSPAAGTFQ